MGNSIVRQKSYDFAIKIVKFYKFLVYKKGEIVLAKQLLRSGTSIGANIEEALGGQSKKDFIAKMSIAYKEAREANYWIRLIIDTVAIGEHENLNVLSDCNELVRIISSILLTSKNNS